MDSGYVEHINANHASIIALLKDLIFDEFCVVIQVASCYMIVFTSFDGSTVGAFDLSKLASLEPTRIDIRVDKADARCDAIR